MNLNEYLSNYYKGTKNPSLKAMEFFMEEFGHPERSLKAIHIAGTNGKGSCTEMMTNILIKAGYKVGKFLSPHLIKYNERISIQNRNISDQEMEALINKIHPAIEKYNRMSDIKVTLFELETTMAILYFYEHNCDFVVLETGLGGLYDCTNVVNPIVSIISSIGYDHMHILGNTLAEIAVQKAGIIKEKSHTVFAKQAEQEVNSTIIDTCKRKNNTLHLVNLDDVKNYSYDQNYQKFDYKNHKNIIINLKGEKQISNACICIECVEALKTNAYNISEDALKEGLKTVVHKGRFEVVSEIPKIVFDGAHNEPAIQNFLRSVEMYFKNEQKVYIISILKTKDYKSILRILLKDKDATFIFTDGNNRKTYESKEEMLEFTKTISSNNRLYAYELPEAIDLAKTQYKNSVIFCIGSFYVYGDVLKLI